MAILRGAARLQTVQDSLHSFLRRSKHHLRLTKAMSLLKVGRNAQEHPRWLRLRVLLRLQEKAHRLVEDPENPLCPSQVAVRLLRESCLLRQE